MENKKRREPYIERVDDLPILFGLLQQMRIQSIIDSVITPHGNWQGLTPGWVMTIWLMNILSEQNHCMEPVQNDPTVCAKILNLLAQTDPDFHLALLGDLELLTLFGRPEDKITPALKGAERGQRLQQVARQALRLSRLLNQHLDQTTHLPPKQQLGLRLLLAYLDKIISDETKVTANNPADPDEVTIAERKHGHKGHYRIGSATDFDPTYRKHDNNKAAILGFNPTILTTSVFIRETQVDTGAQQDNIALPEVLQAQYDHHTFFPDFVAGDIKYGYGKTRHLVAQVTDNQTQVIALLPNYDKRSDLYNPRDFSLSDDGLALTCPNNLTTNRRYLTEDKGGADFRFSAKCCCGCDHWDQCRGPDSKKSEPRNVFISFYRDQVEAAQQFNETDIDPIHRLLQHPPQFANI